MSAGWNHTPDAELVAKVEAAKQQVEVGAVYRHSKTGLIVKVVAVGLNEADEQPVVVYEHQGDPNLTWVRFLDVFVEPVEVDGQTVPRFVGVD
jgi:hypothetical protein